MKDTRIVIIKGDGTCYVGSYDIEKFGEDPSELYFEVLNEQKDIDVTSDCDWRIIDGKLKLNIIGELH